MLRYLAVFAVLFAVAGCGESNPSTAQVSGKVTLDGEPVEGALVLFIPDDPANKAATASSQSDGSYTLTTFEAGDGAMPGSYKIKVSKKGLEDGGHNPYGASPAESRTADEIEPMTPEEELAAMEAAYSPQDANPGGRTQPAKNDLPAKYDDITTSGLTYTVTEGENNHDIELTK